MISVEELKDSLRHQLSALIALYEDDPDALAATRHVGEEPPMAALPGPEGVACAPAADPASTEGDAADPPEGEGVRALEIETCLVAFDAAIRAAERAARARDELQRAAHAAMDRSAGARRVATALRQELQRALLACGRAPGLAAADLESARLIELRLSVRRADTDARTADRDALGARRRAERAIAAASAALLAAVQADPARGNVAFDGATARAARAVAERAAEQAESSLADAASVDGGGATVIAFERISSVPGRTSE